MADQPLIDKKGLAEAIARSKEVGTTAGKNGVPLDPKIVELSVDPSPNQREPALAFMLAYKDAFGKRKRGARRKTRKYKSKSKKTKKHSRR